MKVKLLSDVHTEFWEKMELSPGTGEVLILAGDIGLVGDLGTKRGYLYQQFLDLCSYNYEKVFYVMGNHEHYEYDITKTTDTLRNYIGNNVTLLDDQSEYYKGVHFVGSTLWADFDNGNGLTMNHCKRIMSDYSVIMHRDRLLEPEDTLKKHTDACEWLDRCLDSLRGTVVMVSHHAPHHNSISGRYGKGEHTGAYVSNMEWMMERYPSITHWCHGHVHTTNNYNVFGCNVLSNPFGYHDSGLNKGFNESYEFEVYP